MRTGVTNARWQIIPYYSTTIGKTVCVKYFVFTTWQIQILCIWSSSYSTVCFTNFFKHIWHVSRCQGINTLRYLMRSVIGIHLILRTFLYIVSLISKMICAALFWARSKLWIHPLPIGRGGGWGGYTFP